MSVERTIYVYRRGLCQLAMKMMCKEGKCEVEEREIDKLVLFLMSEGYIIREQLIYEK